MKYFRTENTELVRPQSTLGTYSISPLKWPYCLKRCSYCNFNKYIPKDNNNHIMTQCLLRETETLLQLSQVSCITSVFFGGGTPSLAHPSTVSALLELVSRRVGLADTTEVTLEVNPTPEGRSKLKDFSQAGVNRFSIGVQSLQQESLKLLGRDHSPKQAVQTIEEARRLCPGRVSVDVIFGRPNQTLQSWEAELSELLMLSDQHVSLYQLTPERGTLLFKQLQGGEVALPDEHQMAEMYESARRMLQEHGFQQYEVSNFARHNAVSHHNMNYWKARQYIGVGPGAHGRFVPLAEGGVQREARTQTLEPDQWIREVRQMGHGTRRRILLGRLELLEEALVMGLRTTEGITHEDWQLFSPQLDLGDIFGSSADVQDFFHGCSLILDDKLALLKGWSGLTGQHAAHPAAGTGEENPPAPKRVLYRPNCSASLPVAPPPVHFEVSCRVVSWCHRSLMFRPQARTPGGGYAGTSPCN
ncbi:radical S-adenosyl methionine domain-containing protein 1, mitochondrial isoform X2 [Nerophis ophidion]|uniref:radical S-adenosyl methionine domain-containing protein 1, mitochondrial isoform X2 n=1 Tax=Nerophis ophidion TaxID=159077 RepID=UPI002ADF22B8|nr:radical S-adenosyl methionine domain-containing protein 1, mitochondrial isoform X2 [Nerophis ophidion]